MTRCDTAPAGARARRSSRVRAGAGLLTAALSASGGAAAAQTAQPEVEVDLEVLEALVPTPETPNPDPFGDAPFGFLDRTDRIPGAVSAESVLLLPAPDAQATTRGEGFASSPPTPGDRPEPGDAAALGTGAGPEGETAVAAVVDSNDAFLEVQALLERTDAIGEVAMPEPAATMTGIDTAAAVADDAVFGPGDLRLTFEGDGDELDDAAKDALLGLAARLETRRDRRVELRAYASGRDATPGAARLLALSRALAVRSFLIENNVRSTRIDVKALGDAQGDGPPDRIDIVLTDR